MLIHNLLNIIMQFLEQLGGVSLEVCAEGSSGGADFADWLSDDIEDLNPAVWLEPFGFPVGTFQRAI
jgi:hypothetical protein